MKFLVHFNLIDEAGEEVMRSRESRPLKNNASVNWCKNNNS